MTDLPIRSLPDGSDIRGVAPADLPQVMGAVARGFYDDPFFSWLLPRADRRREQIKEMFTLFAERFWLVDGQSYTTDRLIGGSFWMPPGKTDLGLLDLLRLIPPMVRICRRDFLRMTRVQGAMDKEHPREPHWYLPMIAIEPEWQGRGFGAALLRPILQRCDSEGLPAYLEASCPRNRALYERHGFTVVGEIRVGDSPPLLPMWREPGLEPQAT